MMVVGFHSIVGGVSNQISEEHQHLSEKRSGIRLRMRRDGSHYFASGAMVGGIIHNRPYIFLLELCRWPVRLGSAVLMIAA
jgi:hypothetical protein